MKLDYSKNYEFFYKIPDSLEIPQNENSTANEELDKAIADLNSWLETPPETKASSHNYLKEGEPLTKEKITEQADDAKDPHQGYSKFHSITFVCQNMLNHSIALHIFILNYYKIIDKQAEVVKNAGTSSTSVLNNTDTSHDAWLASLCSNDSKANQSWLYNSKMAQPLSFENNEPHKIILFGNCFIFDNQYTRVQGGLLMQWHTLWHL